MTTPVPPYNLSTPDGAVTVGGGSWNYGQTITEATHRAGFELEAPTPDNMLDLLRIALEQLPRDAMGPWAVFLDAAEGFLDAADFAGQVIDSLIVRPVLQTVEAFTLWVTNFFESFAPGIGDSINGFVEWFNANISSPLATWIANVQTFFAQLLGTPEEVLGNIGNVIADGVKTVSDFFSGLWDAFTGNTGSSGISIDSATLAAAALNTRTNTAQAGADAASAGGQQTIDYLYDAFNGTTGASGVSRTSMRSRGAAVRASAVTGEVNASTALSNAATAQGQANTATANAAAAQTTADDAKTVGNALVSQGQNLIADPSFENGFYLSGPGAEKSSAMARTGNTSVRLTGNGAYPYCYVSTSLVGVAYLPANAGETYRFEVWYRGDAENTQASVAGIRIGFTWFDTSKANLGSPVQTFNCGTAYLSSWTKATCEFTAPAGTAYVMPYVQLAPSVAVGEKWYFDDAVMREETLAIAAQQDADVAQADAATGIANAATAQGAAVAAQNSAATAQSTAVAAQGSADDAADDAAAAAAAAALADGKAVTAQSAASNAQSTADTANTSAGTANTNLQTTVDYLYDAFNGSSGSTGVARTTMRERGAAVRSTAVTGAANASTAISNAATAQGTADTAVSAAAAADNKADTAQSAADSAQLDADAAQAQADTATINAATAQGTADSAASAAATADGKAVAAQSAADDADAKAVAAQALLDAAVTSGANLVPDPSFENPALDAKRLNVASYSGWWTHTDEQAHTGTRCMKLTYYGQSYPEARLVPSLNRANNSSEKANFIPTEAGRTYYVSQWVYLKSPNNGTRTTSIYLITWDEGFTAPGYAVIQANPPLDTWTRIEGLLTVNDADAKYLAPLFGCLRPGNDTGAVMYLDDCEIIDVTEAYNAKLEAEAAQATANTGVTNAALAQTAANTADGKAVAAQATADTAVTDAANAQTTANTASSSAGTANTNLQITWNDLYDAFNGSSGSSGQTSSAVRNRGAAVRTSAVTGEANASTALVNAATAQGTADSATTAAATADTKAVNAQLDADAAQAQANTATTNAATADAKAVTADGKAVNAQLDADAAQADAATAVGKAVAAQTNFTTYLYGGQNLLPNPSYENTSYALNYSMVYSTEQSRSGARSVKISGTGAVQYPQIGGSGRIKAVAGQVFAYEFWAYGHDSNMITGTQELISFGLWCYDKANVYQANVRGGATADTLGKNEWRKFYGTLVIPNDPDIIEVQPLWYVTANLTANNHVYVDDVVLRDVTEAYAAQLDADLGILNASTADGKAVLAQNAADTADGKAVDARAAADDAQLDADAAFNNAATAQSTANTAQSSADLAAAVASSVLTSGDNIIPNSSFEEAATLWSQNGASITSEAARTGTKSLKLANGSSPYSYLFNGATGAYALACKSGDVFKFSYWVRGVSDNVTCTARFGIASFNEVVSNVLYHVSDYSLAASTSWVQVTGTVTIPTTTNTRFRPYLQFLGSSSNVVYFDDVVVQRITEVAETNQALYGQNTPGTAIQTDAVPTLPQAKVSGLPVGFLVEDELAQHAAEISELKATREVTVNQGKTISINFSNYANASSLPTTGSQRWSTTYSGSGTATWGISSGKAAWIGSTSVERTAKVIYLGDGTAGSEKTLTDYQVLRGVLQNPPLNQEFTAMARVSDDGNTYVWAKAIATLGFFTVNVTGSIGCVVNGVSTTWQSNIPLTWSTEMTLKCGVDGNPRKFQVFSGTQLVTEYTESGTASGLGAGYRRFGAIAKCGNNATSGTISSVTVSDNPPVVYAGSVARMSRESSGNVGTVSTTDTALPASFFDEADFESLDIDGDLTAGSFTVSKSKMYMVSARVKLSSYLDANGYLNLQRSTNGGSTWATTQKGPSVWGADTGAGAIGPSSGFVLTGTWLQYLEAGDKVRLSAQVDRSSRTSIFTGGGTGEETYFTISGMG